MTYQSSPYMPWIFPDEAYHMNRVGMKPLRPVPIKNGFDLLPGGGSEAQTRFDNHDNKVAMDRVRNTKRKEQGMLGHLNTTVRSQRYDRAASRSAVPNGVFHGSPMEYLTSAGLRGGVITTKEGQEWLQKRLKQRAQEYGDISSGNFSSGPPKHIDVSPYNDVDTLLQSAFTSFTAGSFSSGLNDTLNRLLQAFIRIGAIITPRQLTPYAQAIQQMMITTQAYDGRQLGEERGFAYEGREKRLRTLDAVNETLKLIDATIKEIARVIYDPQSTREQVMSTLSSRLLGRQIAQYRPGHVGEEQQETISRQTGELPLGRAPGQSSMDVLPRSEAAVPLPGGAFGEDEVEASAGRTGLYDDLPAIGERAGLGRRRRHRY